MTYLSNAEWDADFRDKYKHNEYEGLSGSRDNCLYSTEENQENLIPDLADLTDEEFLQRLSDMRREHQQTLEFCDRHGLHSHDPPESEKAKSPYPVASVDENYAVTTHNYRSLAGDLMTTNVRDRVCPPFRARRAPTRKQVPAANPCRKSTRRDRERQLREEFENEQQKMRQYALDKYLASLSDEDCAWDDENSDVTKRTKPKRALVRSNSLTKLGDDSWQYRITVPKPFKMTVRESQKPPMKSRSSADYERQRARQHMEENLECNMKFKASPAPATIYVPLYEEQAANEDRRRQKNLAVRQQQLLEMQRPFAFLRREEDRLVQKTRREMAYAAADAAIPDANFKAKPFPHHLFSNEAYERMAEQEDVKEWQRQARAEKLLRTSSLPKNMTKKRPSHVCDMTSEDGCSPAGSQPGSVRRRSPRRVCHHHQDEADDDAEVCRCHVHLSPQRPSSSVAHPGSGDQVRWPHTSIDANPFSRSLSDMVLSSHVTDAGCQTSPRHRPRQGLKSILKSSSQFDANARRSRTGGVHVTGGQRRTTATRGRPVSPRTMQPASVKATSVGRRWSAKTVDDDRIRREIEEDLKHID